jgi:hypothetical protein
MERLSIAINKKGVFVNGLRIPVESIVYVRVEPSSPPGPEIEYQISFNSDELLRYYDGESMYIDFLFGYSSVRASASIYYDNKSPFRLEFLKGFDVDVVEENIDEENSGEKEDYVMFGYVLIKRVTTSCYVEL